MQLLLVRHVHVADLEAGEDVGLRVEQGARLVAGPDGAVSPGRAKHLF